MIDALQLESYDLLHTVAYNSDSVGMTLFTTPDLQQANDVLARLKGMRPSDLKKAILLGKGIESSAPTVPARGSEYKQVLGGFDIAKKVVDFMEDCDPHHNDGSNRTQAIGWVTDILHGRNEMSTTALMNHLEGIHTFGNFGRYDKICQHIRVFEKQKRQMNKWYSESPKLAPNYDVPIDDVNGRRLKIIDQAVYDKAVIHGFSADFFKNAYFDNVVFFALPEKADFSASILEGCKFNVCAARGALFSETSLYSSDFQTVDLTDAQFPHATLAHTHFTDVDMQGAGFHSATLNNCNFTHCNMWEVDLLETRLKEVRFGAIKEPKIWNLDTATFSFGAVEPNRAIQMQERAFAELGRPLPHRCNEMPPQKAAPEPSR